SHSINIPCAAAISSHTTCGVVNISSSPVTCNLDSSILTPFSNRRLFMSRSKCFPSNICFIKQRACKPRNTVVLTETKLCDPQVFCQPQSLCSPQIVQPELPPCPNLITPRYGDFGANAITAPMSGLPTALLTTLINGPTNVTPLLTANGSTGAISIPFTGRYLVTYGANVVTPPTDGKAETTAPTD